MRPLRLSRGRSKSPALALGGLQTLAHLRGQDAHSLSLCSSPSSPLARTCLANSLPISLGSAPGTRRNICPGRPFIHSPSTLGPTLHLPGLEGVGTEKTASFFSCFPEDNNMITDTYNKVFTMCQAPFSCVPCINSFHPYETP